MERIRHALEQAEQDRLKLQKETPAPVQGWIGPEANRDGSDTGASDTQPVSAENICFSRTRVIDVDREVFEMNRLVSAIPNHELSDIYRLLRTRVLQSMNTNNWNSLAITSAATGSGKTLTSINLAISLSREVNRTVLLADFDLRCPSIHRYFGCQP